MGHPASSRSNLLSTLANMRCRMESSLRFLTSLDPCSSSILCRYSFVMGIFFFNLYVTFLLIFYNFCCVLLSLLFFVGYYLPAPTWINFVASVWPSTAPICFVLVPLIQQSLHCGCCLHYNKLFTKFFCICHHLMQPWKKALLIYHYMLFGPFEKSSSEPTFH